jgi:hypothetical protein
MIDRSFTFGTHQGDGRTETGLAVRFGLMHYATFPESLAGLDAFKPTLELALSGQPWDVPESSTETAMGWTSAVRELAR